MNCAEANQIDMVDYLSCIAYQPRKIHGHDYWFLSPFRDEKYASFKVERNKNVWYDHGIGKGGTLIDFVVEFYRCEISEALQKLSSFHPQNIVKIDPERHRFHLHENSLISHNDATETGIRIIAQSSQLKTSFFAAI